MDFIDYIALVEYRWYCFFSHKRSNSKKITIKEATGYRTSVAFLCYSVTS